MNTRIRTHRRLRRATLGTALAVVVSSSAQAAWDVYPEVTAEYGLDDNIRLSPFEEDKAGVGAAEGKVILRNVGETHNVRAAAGLRHSTYSGTDLKSGTTGSMQLSAEKRSERITYGVVGSYQNQPLLRFGAIDLATGEIVGDASIAQQGTGDANPTPIPDLDIGFVEEEVRRQFAQVAPSVSFTLSDRSSLRFGGSFYAAAYDSDAELLGLEDYENYGLSTQYTYRLSERSTVHLGLSAETTDADVSDDSDRQDVLIGFSRQLAEGTLVMVEAGVGRAKSDNGRKDTAALYRGTLEHRLENGHISVYLSRDNYPTGFGNTIRTDTLQAEWRTNLTERIDFRLRGMFLKADSNLDAGVTFEDREYADAEGRVSYALTPAWRIGGAYRYRWTDRDIDPNTASGNAAFFFVSFAPPRPF